MELSKINDLDQLKKLWVDTQKMLGEAQEAYYQARKAHNEAEGMYERLQVKINQSEVIDGKPMPPRKPTENEAKQLLDMNFHAAELALNEDYCGYVVNDLEKIQSAVRCKLRVLMLQKQHPELDIDTVRKIAVPRNAYANRPDTQEDQNELALLGGYEGTDIPEDLFKSAIG